MCGRKRLNTPGDFPLKAFSVNYNTRFSGRANKHWILCFTCRPCVNSWVPQWNWRYSLGAVRSNFFRLILTVYIASWRNVFLCARACECVCVCVCTRARGRKDKRNVTWLISFLKILPLLPLAFHSLVYLFPTYYSEVTHSFYSVLVSISLLRPFHLCFIP